MSEPMVVTQSGGREKGYRLKTGRYMNGRIGFWLRRWDQSVLPLPSQLTSTSTLIHPSMMMVDGLKLYSNSIPFVGAEIMMTGCL
jgi:hypothetical protein